MAHKHLCMRCLVTIAEGSFDCDYDRDHDWSYCDKCARETDTWHKEHLSHRVSQTNNPGYLRCVTCNSTLVQ